MKAIETGFVIETTKKKNSKKWDKCVADYENYFKEYMKHYNYSQNGDQTSLRLYPYLRARWETLKERIFDAHSNKYLTEKQIQKVVKINMKIVKAVF